MKVLHIGKKGNVERFSNPSEIVKNMELLDMAAGLSEEEYLANAADADYIIADAMAKVSGALISRMPNLKMIHSEGVGYNFFDLETASKRGIYVCNCKGMNAMAVAEQTILLMLGLLRDVKNGDEAVRNGHQIEKKEGYMKEANLLELADCRVGLLGFGDIAKCVAGLLKEFRAEVFYYDLYRAEESAESQYQVIYCSFDEILNSCDMVSMHLPVTAETENIADDDFFGKMKQGAYFVNTARGELVDSGALIRALQSGKLEMAGLDTVAGEPVKADHLLLKQDDSVSSRLLFSPHIGGITSSSFKRGYSMIWADIQNVIDGNRPERVVNKIVGTKGGN